MTAPKVSNPETLDQTDPRYPLFLKGCPGVPPVLSAVGSLELLSRPLVALVCSIQCPGSLILRAYDLARTLRDAGVTVISGFHSPIEKECLALLLKGKQPIIICPARSVAGMRIPSAWRGPLNEGRLLLISSFGVTQRRATLTAASDRNTLIVQLSRALLIIHAATGSKTEQLCRQAVSFGKPTFALESEENGGVISLGAKPVKLEDITHYFTHSARNADWSMPIGRGKRADDDAPAEVEAEDAKALLSQAKEFLAATESFLNLP